MFSYPSKLFSPFKLRNITFKNRIFVSPMCMYSAIDGVPNSWHMVHLGSRAVGGAGLVMVEATAISPNGRISDADLGLWNDEQQAAFQPITAFIKVQNSIAGIQLAHAGRKSEIPGNVGPSALAFSDRYKIPHELTKHEMALITNEFVHSAVRAQKAGFEVIELHFAHGYLFHEFLSPLSNHRSDEYGGSLENRMRYPLEVAQAVRQAWPDELPLFVRISATDWVKAGWDLLESIVFSHKLKNLGIDLIDCSTGGNVPDAKIPTGPGYQVPFAAGVRKEVGIATGAVGLITSGLQGEKIIEEELADVVFLAREMLRDPYFPLHAAKELGVEITWPKQYERAKN
ncbi:MAG: NADPH dehydrogenase NamA [Bdellovibrionaceae bacterium]|nr:NADPH dehydrogenase NamA [Pseudobdellovibrionaceae bacterium]